MNAAAPPAQREINLVAVCYQRPPDRFAASLQRIAQRHGVALRGVIVCNRARQVQARLQDSRFDLAQGSNALLDFSGFFEGLERLLSTRPEAAASNVLFVNDSLFTKHAASCILGRVLSLDALMRQLQVPAMAGKVAPFRSICRQNPWSGDRGFVPTFCYMLNARGLPLLQQLKSLAAEDDVFADAAVSDEAWGRKMPTVLREHIRAHLAYQGSLTVAGRCDRRRQELLRKKTACVFLEIRACPMQSAARELWYPSYGTAILHRHLCSRVSGPTCANGQGQRELNARRRPRLGWSTTMICRDRASPLP